MNKNEEAEISTGWERERRVHFDEIVETYDKIRPEYPSELFKDILTYSTANKALEIGAGTGKATVPFLSAGFSVTAVELGENMVQFLLSRFNEYKNFNVITSDFEIAPLEDDSYDLVYAASAFHWVNAEIGCPKVFRILKSGGTFALFRYNVIRADGNENYEEIQEIYKKYYHKPYKKPLQIPREEYLEPTEILRGFGFKDLKTYGFTDISAKLYDAALTYSTDEYISFLDTLSDHRSLPESDRTALYAGVKDVINKHGGSYKKDYVFQLYMGRKP
ncbi:MAG: class I SAM-dependent methyltransferase [Oscillospiraceae bacterium]|nr:class I SAM-dependent methyltransferase [Oscillospiraceae bacterium]